ncbi:MAG TPA: phosphomannomutase/phosphoglucomutase, partial [Candidatus Eisenbacteria bacterium]|nr:phosphomannomutase/phosphoglucomutase [Candidatus Eisenbacteria bacterium]
KVLTRENKSLSQVVKEIQRSYESGEFNFKVSNAPEILDVLKEKYKDGELSTLDGIAVTYPNWRFNVRTSNTEPLLRLNLESYDAKTTEEKLKEITALIEKVAKKE